jgi:hypothetical protein
MNTSEHHWNSIRTAPTTLEAEDVISATAQTRFNTYAIEKDVPALMLPRGWHQSIFRSTQILDEVKRMLGRGDSSETVLEFINFCEGG